MNRGSFEDLLNVLMVNDKSHHWIAKWIILLAIAGLGACAKSDKTGQVPTFPVSGKILLNRLPVAGALVVLHPSDGRETKYRGYAKTDAEGNFQVSTFVPGDGAPAGKYHITIQMQDEEAVAIRIPQRFAHPVTSGLRAEIRAEPTQLAEIQLRTP